MYFLQGIAVAKCDTNSLVYFYFISCSDFLHTMCARVRPAGPDSGVFTVLVSDTCDSKVRLVIPY